jgi:catechol 2,3-dioxygenase-like lactoylglutathione lyase family enzyme
MANFIQISPYLSARDVDAMVRFFVDVLGFHAWGHSWDYAYVQREAAAVRIGKASPDTPEERHEAGERAFLMYIDVRDVDAVVEEVRPKLLAAGMAGGSGPEDQTWGQREFWVPVPEGGLIIFGQKIVQMPVIEPPGERLAVANCPS